VSPKISQFFPSVFAVSSWPMTGEQCVVKVLKSLERGSLVRFYWPIIEQTACQLILLLWQCGESVDFPARRRPATYEKSSDGAVRGLTEKLHFPGGAPKAAPGRRLRPEYILLMSGRSTGRAICKGVGLRLRARVKAQRFADPSAQEPSAISHRSARF
jgi:hypothetical protein